ALQAGEDRALETLIHRHQEGVFRFVFRHIPSEADATELTQEAFVRAYFNIGKFRPAAKFVTWLYHIALNLCRDHTRSQAYRYSSQTISIDVSVDENEGQRQPSSNQRKPDRQAQDREKLRAVEKAITELPQELKSPLILTALEDRSYAETGELLGISPKAVEMKVYRARKLLLGKMNELGF
ncbi:MAG TPA: sigma-70 family RNA polymerase sigma factor, partial [Chthoniobacterales bacterium]